VRTLRTLVLPFAMLLGFMLAIVALIHKQNTTGHLTPGLLIVTLFVVAAIVIWALLLGTEI